MSVPDFDFQRTVLTGATRAEDWKVEPHVVARGTEDTGHLSADSPENLDVLLRQSLREMRDRELTRAGDPEGTRHFFRTQWRQEDTPAGWVAKTLDWIMIHGVRAKTPTP